MLFSHTLDKTITNNQTSTKSQTTTKQFKNNCKTIKHNYNQSQIDAPIKFPKTTWWHKVCMCGSLSSLGAEPRRPHTGTPNSLILAAPKGKDRSWPDSWTPSSLRGPANKETTALTPISWTMSQVNAPNPLAPLSKVWVNAPLKFNTLRSVVQHPTCTTDTGCPLPLRPCPNRRIKTVGTQPKIAPHIFILHANILCPSLNSTYTSAWCFGSTCS